MQHLALSLSVTPDDSLLVSLLAHSSPGKVLRVCRIKPHAPPLVRVPVNSFEFQSCDRTPQADDLTR